MTTLKCECAVRWRALGKRQKCLVVVGEELLLGWKALAAASHVPPGAGIRVGLTKETRRWKAYPLPENSPLEQDYVFSSLHLQGLACGGHPTNICNGLNDTPFTWSPGSKIWEMG